MKYTGEPLMPGMVLRRPFGGAWWCYLGDDVWRVSGAVSVPPMTLSGRTLTASNADRVVKVDKRWFAGRFVRVSADVAAWQATRPIAHTEGRLLYA